MWLKSDGNELEFTDVLDRGGFWYACSMNKDDIVSELKSKQHYVEIEMHLPRISIASSSIGAQ